MKRTILSSSQGKECELHEESHSIQRTMTTSRIKTLGGKISFPIHVARTPKRLQRRSKAVAPDASCNPQDLTIFEDDPYADEHTDEEDYEPDSQPDEQNIKPKTTKSHSKRPGANKPRKPNRPREPDRFACLDLGSKSIPSYLHDKSSQCRSRWAFYLLSSTYFKFVDNNTFWKDSLDVE